MESKLLDAGDQSWSILQDPLLLKIFSELKVNEISACSEVCLNWNRIAQDDILWKYLFKRDFLCQKNSSKINATSGNPKPLESSWKNEYERLKDRVPRENIQVLDGHVDEVVHIAFSNDASEFVSCSKDQYFIIWKKETKDAIPNFLCHCKQNMGVYGWLQTYSAQYSPFDTKILVSGVSNETGGEIAIFVRENNSDTIIHRVRNQPFDLMGCWFNDSSFISGSIIWNEETDNFLASVWLCKLQSSSSNNIHKLERSVELIDLIPEDLFPSEDVSDEIDKQEISRYTTNEGANSPHFIQYFCSNNGQNGDVEDSYLVFVCGDKTYVGHQIGFQRIYKRSNEKYTKPIKILEMNGQIVGMKISPNNKYLYVNVRPWESDVNPDRFEAPMISEKIELRKINLTTMEIEKSRDAIFTGHHGFTPSEGAFYLYVDASKSFLASGSEDGFGYIWESNYGVLLEKLCGHSECVNCVVFDPIDEEICVTASDDHTLQIFISNRKKRFRLYQKMMIDKCKIYKK